MRVVDIFCDGACRGNPGPGGVGFVIQDKTKILHKGYKFIGRATNNVVEYMAVLEAMKWLVASKELTGSLFIFFRFHLDSQLVRNQLAGKYKIRNPRLKKIAAEIKKLEKQLACLSARQIISWNKIPREANEVADSLANLALDTRFD